MTRKPREGGKGKPKMKSDNCTESSSSSSSLSSSNDGENGDRLLAEVTCGGSETKMPIVSSNVAVKKAKGRPKTEKGASDQSGPEDWMHPIEKDGEMVLEVECGAKQAHLYLSKLCQGSKGSCIEYDGSWLTPNEFQFICGRESAKDWKRSIRHREKSLKLLVAKGIITIHPKSCDCDGCRVSKKVNKCRLADKRRESFGEAAAAAAKLSSAAACTSRKDAATVTGSDSDENTLDNMDNVTRVQTDDVTMDSSITPLSHADEQVTSSLSPKLKLQMKKTNGVVDDDHAADEDGTAPIATAEAPAGNTNNDRDEHYEEVDQRSPARDGTDMDQCTYLHDRANETHRKTVEECKLDLVIVDTTVTDRVAGAEVNHMLVQVISQSKDAAHEASVEEQESRVKHNVLMMDKTDVSQDGCYTEPAIQSPELDQHNRQGNYENGKEGCTGHCEEQGAIHIEIEEPGIDMDSTPCESAGLIPVQNDQQSDIKINQETEQIIPFSKNTPPDARNANLSQDTKCRVNDSLATTSKEADAICSLEGSEYAHISIDNVTQQVNPTQDNVPEVQATSQHNQQTVSIEHDNSVEETDKSNDFLSSSEQPNSACITDTRVELMNDEGALCKQQQDEHQRHKKNDEHERCNQQKHQEVADYPRKQEEVANNNQHQEQQAHSTERHTAPQKHNNHNSHHHHHHHHHRKEHERHVRDGNKQTVATVRPQKVEPVNSGHSSINKTVPGSSITSTYQHYPSFPYPTQGQLPLGISWPFPIPSSIPDQLQLSSRPTSSTEYMRLLAASHYMHNSSLTPDLPSALSHYAINSRLYAGLPYTYPSMPFYPPHMAMKDVHSFLPSMASAPTMPQSFIPSPLSPHLPPMFSTLPSASLLDYAKLHNLSSAAAPRGSEPIVNTVTGLSQRSDTESQHRKRKSTDGHELEPALDLSTAKKYKAGEYQGRLDSEHHAQKSPSSTALHNGPYQEHKIKLLQSFTGQQDASSSHLQYANRSGARSSTECVCGRVRPITDWTVEEVCDFLRALEGCFPYSERFREQGVDGRILSILTLDQLTHILGMKLGPAVLLTETVLKFLHSAARQGCERCTGSSTSASSAPTFTPVRRPEGILVHAS